jgi:hypothetical protein
VQNQTTRACGSNTWHSVPPPPPSQCSPLMPARIACHCATAQALLAGI